MEKKIFCFRTNAKNVRVNRVDSSYVYRFRTRHSVNIDQHDYCAHKTGSTLSPAVSETIIMIHGRVFFFSKNKFNKRNNDCLFSVDNRPGVRFETSFYNQSL